MNPEKQLEKQEATASGDYPEEGIVEALRVALLLGAEIEAPAGMTFYLATIKDFDNNWVRVYESRVAAESAIFIYVIKCWIEKNRREHAYPHKSTKRENVDQFSPVFDSEWRAALANIEDYLKQDEVASYLSPLRNLYWKKFGEPENWKIQEIARITLEYLSIEQVAMIYFPSRDPDKSFRIQKQQILGKEDLADIREKIVKDFFLNF